MFLTLGSYAKGVSYSTSGDEVSVRKWFSSRDNMGMVLDRPAWSLLASCAASFCTYDDYNWDWSLQHVSQHCLSKPIRSLAVTAARVLHVGECSGLHHGASGKQCDERASMQAVDDLIQESVGHLFPAKLRQSKGAAAARAAQAYHMPPPNGGWSDPRDHDLCLTHVQHQEQQQEARYNNKKTQDQRQEAATNGIS